MLVPASSLSGLSAQQLEMILAHELAHIRRHDYLVNVLQSVAETLLFFHPAAWWVSRQIRIERENCCDDLAVGTCGNAVEYARALTVLEELRDRPALAVAASGGSLLERVKRLIGPNEHRINGWTALAAILTFAVVMTITSLPLQALDPDVPPPPPPPTPAAVPTPMPAPRVRPVIAPSPMPSVAPLPPMAVVAAGDFAMDFDYDLEPEEFEETESGKLSIDELIARGQPQIDSLFDEVRPGRELQFRVVGDLRIPAPRDSADVVCFFSVMTHLRHEHSYIYLRAARRVVKPTGRIVLAATPIGNAGDDVPPDLLADAATRFDPLRLDGRHVQEGPRRRPVQGQDGAAAPARGGGEGEDGALHGDGDRHQPAVHHGGPDWPEAPEHRPHPRDFPISPNSPCSL